MSVAVFELLAEVTRQWPELANREWAIEGDIARAFWGISRGTQWVTARVDPGWTRYVSFGSGPWWDIRAEFAGADRARVVVESIAVERPDGTPFLEANVAQPFFGYPEGAQ